MATNCRSCGANLPEGAGRCPVCLALVKPPGFFQRLFGGFKINFTVNTGRGRAADPGIHFKTSVQRSQSFQIRDTATGETKVYHSLEEVPEKYREQISRAMAVGKVDRNEKIGLIRTVDERLGKRSEKITFVGPDGTRHSYDSMDKVPPDVRKLIEDEEQSRNDG